MNDGFRCLCFRQYRRLAGRAALCVGAFNIIIQMFPGSLVNVVINRKKTILPFSGKETSARFDCKPNF